MERRRQLLRRARGRGDRRGARVGGPGGGGEGVAATWLAMPAAPNDAAFLLRSAAGAFALAGFLPFAAPALGAPPGEAQRAGGFGLLLTMIAAALGAGALAGFAPGAAAARFADRGRAGRRGGLAAGGGSGARRRADGGARLRRRSLGRLCAVRSAGEPPHRAVAADHAAGDRRVRVVAVDRGLVDPPRALAWALGLNLALVFPAVALGARRARRNARGRGAAGDRRRRLRRRPRPGLARGGGAADPGRGAGRRRARPARRRRRSRCSSGASRPAAATRFDPFADLPFSRAGMSRSAVQQPPRLFVDPRCRRRR